jgi:biopolymer transport protein ExbD
MVSFVFASLLMELQVVAAPGKPLVLEVNARCEVRVPGRKEVLRTRQEIAAFLRAEIRKAGSDPTKDAGKTRPSVLLRVDREVPYAGVQRLLDQCRDAGYKEIRVQVLKN